MNENVDEARRVAVLLSALLVEEVKPGRYWPVPGCNCLVGLLK
jgi:hypothetical protein